MRNRFNLAGIVVIIVIIAIAAMVFLPALSASREKDRNVTSINNLKQIGLACLKYASEHGGKLPEDLQELYKEKYITDVRIFRSPYDRNPKTAKVNNSYSNPSNNYRISYTYYPGHYNNEPGDMSKIIIAEDNDAPPHFRWVLCLDGHVEPYLFPFPKTSFNSDFHRPYNRH